MRRLKKLPTVIVGLFSLREKAPTKKGHCYSRAFFLKRKTRRLKTSWNYMISWFATNLRSWSYRSMFGYECHHNWMLLFLWLVLAESLVLNDEIVQWIKLKLRAHFMNPCQKYKAKGTKPVKMIVQIIKILFVTLQVSARLNSNCHPLCVAV